MADVAALGISVDSKQAVSAADDLDELSAAAKRAETSTSRLADFFRKADAHAIKLDGSLKAINAGLKSFARSATTQLVAFVGATAGIAAMITATREFDAALAELSTLLSGSEAELQQFAATARDLAGVYGGTATAQVQGFYQAISAGATGAAQATAILDSANKVAIGGITSVETAVDALTTATNAYAASGLEAADAADALFVGMRAGKTTIDELAAQLGQVIPVAAGVGVEFEATVAAIAALTTQGLSTSQAVTGLRQALTNIIKPSAQATELAEALGINFNAAGLEAEGFAQFMDTVIAATGGSTEQLAQLFGSVEAVTVALSLAGGGGDKFADILDQMGERAGAANEAFERVAQSLDFRLNRALAILVDYALTAGQQLLRVLVPALEAIARWLPTIARLAGVAGTALTVAFGPAILVAVRNLAAAIGLTLVGSIKALTVAIATNPLGALAVAIATAASSIYLFRDAIRELTGIDIDAFLSRITGGFLGGEAEAAEFADSLGELDAILADMPSIDDLLASGTVDGIEAASTAYRDLHQEQARAIELAQADLFEARGDDDMAKQYREAVEWQDLLAKGEGDLSERQRENLAGQLEQLRAIRAETEILQEVEAMRAGFQTDEEAEIEKRDRRLELLREALEMEAITKAEYRELEMAAMQEFHDWEFEQIDARYQQERALADEMAAYERSKMQERMAGASQFFGNLATITAVGGKKVFAVTKAFQIAQGIIDAYAAAAGAYKVGASIGGPALGAAFAAVAFGAQMARVASMQATEIGNTSASNRQAAGNVAPAAPAPAAPAQDVTVRIDSDRNLFTRADIQQIIAGISDAVGDGANLRLASA